MRCRIAVALAVAMALPVAADEGEPLAARPRLEWALAVAGGAIWLTETLAIGKLAPTECHWCDSNALDDAAREVEWGNQQAARRISDVLSYGLAPAAAGGLLTLGAFQDGRPEELVTDLVIVAESAVIAGVSGDFLRVVTGRERPWIHDLAPADKPLTERPEQNNLSFISGHTATAFAMAVSGATVARRRGRRIAPALWATGLTLGAVSGYLRVASGQHYLTDVLAGVGWGVAIGFTVPYLHRHRAGAVAASLAPARGGALVLLTFQ
jgi:membrane-associated phospholipid phosphatase